MPRERACRDEAYSFRAPKIGVVVLTNSGNAGANDIGMRLLDPSNALAPLSFVRDPQGVVTSLVLNQRGQTTPGMKVK